MTPERSAFLKQHVAVLLFGLTGILGALITVDGYAITWWRILFTVLSFLLWPGMLKKVMAMPRKAHLRLFGIGILVAVHWVTFFGAIAMTNASVTLSMLASIAFFTSILEPLITRSRFQWYEVALGITVVPGVILIEHSTSFPIEGILVALFSALCAALFSIFNKLMVSKHEPVTMTFVELSAGWMFLTLLMPVVFWLMPEAKFQPVGVDFLYLAFLALGCTTLAYVLSLSALKSLSTFTVNLILNLEPVYTIILAWLLLNEDDDLNMGFYIGAGIIIASVSIHPFLRARQPKKVEDDF